MLLNLCHIRDFIIKKQLPMKCTKSLSYFYAPKILIPSLNSSFSANHDKVKRLSANSEILIKEVDSPL